MKADCALTSDEQCFVVVVAEKRLMFQTNVLSKQTVQSCFAA